MKGYNKLTIEIDNYDLERLKVMAEEEGYDNLDEYATELFNFAMCVQDDVDFIVSLPKSIVELLDRDIKIDGYESRSDVIAFILRTYYSNIGRFLR